MYIADSNRYKKMNYSKCGNSGLMLPKIALGLWNNFGTNDSIDKQKELIFEAFNNGITHFDLANNYGPEYGAAEENFGKILENNFLKYRDEIIVSTKAGYDMWSGPYGNGGSRKHLMTSLDQSLNRLNLDYVDIFYHHRPDTDTPLEETMNTLSDIVKQGKALYIGLSNYNSEQIKNASKILKENKTPCLIHQFNYNMFSRGSESNGLHTINRQEGIGSIAFCPLAQGLLTNRYIDGIPENSRAKKETVKFLNESDITKEKIEKIIKLNQMAVERNQSLAQMSLAWVLRKNEVTTALIGASTPQQIRENAKTVENLNFTEEELKKIDLILEQR